MSTVQFVQILNGMYGGNVWVEIPGEDEKILKGASKDVTLEDLNNLPLNTTLSTVYPDQKEGVRLRSYWVKEETLVGPVWSPVKTVTVGKIPPV